MSPEWARKVGHLKNGRGLYKMGEGKKSLRTVFHILERNRVNGFFSAGVTLTLFP